jgi:hypothetical protein
MLYLGFSTIFPVTDLCIFTPEELVLLFGDPEEDWSVESKSGLALDCHRLPELTGSSCMQRSRMRSQPTTVTASMQ